MVLGCDIGTAFTKAVVFDGNEWVYRTKTPTEADPTQATERILAQLARDKGVARDDLEHLVVTGWGQGKLALAHQPASTLNCLARGALWSAPGCGAVLCLGAQQSTVLSVNPKKGRVVGYRENDKCASGAGRFLEIILEALECTVEESEAVARTADREITMSSQCAVFAESEVVSLVNDGESVANIIEAILQSLAKSVVSLTKKIKLKGPLVVGGGLLNNQRIEEILRKQLQSDFTVFQPAPDFIAAVGAALSANGGAQ